MVSNFFAHAESFNKRDWINIEEPTGSGYKEITPEELKYLARCVELLRNQTETSCETKMESFI